MLSFSDEERKGTRSFSALSVAGGGYLVYIFQHLPADIVDTAASRVAAEPIVVLLEFAPVLRVFRGHYRCQRILTLTTVLKIYIPCVT